MSLKKPIVRVLLLALFAVVVIGYFVFSNYLFSPFEGRYTADVSTLVPRGVDFFVAKAKLVDDFSDFPRLSIADEVGDTKAWRALQRSPEYGEFEQTYDLEGIQLQLEDIKKQTRGLNLLKVFGGSDIALAGYFKGPTMDQADWAAYGRVNFIGKVGVSMLKFPGLIGLENQGISAAVEDDYFALSGGELPREIYVAKIFDVAVVGTSLELVQQALELNARKGQDSFGQSATYFDNIENVDRGVRRNEVELHFDWRAYSEATMTSGRWPDTESQEYLTRLMGRLFQIGSVKNMTGVLRFETGLTLDLHGDLSSELMTPVQKSIYRQRGAERAWVMHNAARMAPADTSLFLYLEIDVGDFLRELFAAAEPAARQNLEDLIRGTGKYNGVEALIDEFDTIFRDRVMLIVRENDYEEKTGDPPHDDEPVPAFALVLWNDGEPLTHGRINGVHLDVVTHQRRLGLVGRDGDNGVYKNELDTGHIIWEFWQPMVPGTGHVSAVIDANRYILSNNYHMLEDLLFVYATGGSRYPRLSERLDFKQLMNEGLPQANLVAWFNPRAMAKISGRYHQRNAELQVTDNIDWRLERAREEDKVLREQFPGVSRGNIDDDTQEKLNGIVDQAMDTLRKNLVTEQVPAIRARLERNTLYSELVSGSLVMLALDPKYFDLYTSIIVPLDE